jgi:hypothetical protein
MRELTSVFYGAISVTLGCSVKAPKAFARPFHIGRYSPWFDTPEPFNMSAKVAAFSGA